MNRSRSQKCRQIRLNAERNHSYQIIRCSQALSWARAKSAIPPWWWRQYAPLKVGILLLDYMAQHPRRQSSSPYRFVQSVCRLSRNSRTWGPIVDNHCCATLTLDHISAAKAYEMRREKHIWNVSVLQGVQLSNLLPIVITIKVVYCVTA
jgi:hypothetical protein